jgi:hypothetical protein
MKEELSWKDAVRQAIIDNGYVATLKQIYETVPKYRQMSGNTPQKTIQAIVQNHNIGNIFVRLKLSDKSIKRTGLYGLTEFMDKIPQEYNPNVVKDETQQQAITHSYIQGMLLEIGNLRGLKTFSPASDKNKIYAGKTIGELATLERLPIFTYDKIVDITKNIDVVYVNERKYPSAIIEIEHTTNFKNSLLKFLELQDFRLEMKIVAPMERKQEFEKVISMSAFSSIAKHVKFVDYNAVTRLYDAQLKLFEASMSF